MDTCLNIDDIVDIKEIELDFVYDLSIKKNHNYFIWAGKPILVHNSRKTWSAIDFIIYLTSRKITNKVINIIRDTYSGFKTTLYNDFNQRLPEFGIVSPFENTEDVRSFKLFGNKIQLIGADKVSSFEGLGCDFAYFNEIINISKEIFDQQEMRCGTFWFADCNPKVLESWVYDLPKRDDVDHLITTFLDNPFAPPNQVRKILSYEPTHPDDRHKPYDERRPHPVNVKNQTADRVKWEVYGLGLRASPEGLVFPYVNEYTELPDEDLYTLFGIDWGGNDPTTLIEINIDEANKTIYIRQHLYTPQILNSKLIDLIWKINPTNRPVVVDSARKDKKFELTSAGIQAYGATKGAGSKIDGIERVQEYRIFIHKESHDVLREYRSYSWAVDKKTGKSLNEPQDGNDHTIDPTLYIMRFFKRNIKPN